MKKRVWWWVAGLALLALALAFVPGIFVQPDFSKPETWSQWGAWLQGSLTPALLFVAIVSFLTQARAQAKANRIASRALFVSNVEGMTKHIASLCLLSLAFDGEMDAADIEGYPQNNMNRLLSSNTCTSLKYKGRAWLVSPTNVIRTDAYAQLYNTVTEAMLVASLVHLSCLLDPRIVRLHSLAQKYPPSSPSSQPSQP